MHRNFKSSFLREHLPPKLQNFLALIFYRVKSTYDNKYNSFPALKKLYLLSWLGDKKRWKYISEISQQIFFLTFVST